MLGSWFYLPGPARYWAGATVAIFFIPAWSGVFFAVLRAPRGRRALVAWARDTLDNFAKGNALAVMSLTFLLHQASALDGCHLALGGPHRVHATQASRMGDRRRVRSVRRPEGHGGCVPGVGSLVGAGPRRGALANSPRGAAGGSSRVGAVDGLARLFGLAEPPPARRALRSRPGGPAASRNRRRIHLPLFPRLEFAGHQLAHPRQRPRRRRRRDAPLAHQSRSAARCPHRRRAPGHDAADGIRPANPADARPRGGAREVPRPPLQLVRREHPGAPAAAFRLDRG